MEMDKALDAAAKKSKGSVIASKATQLWESTAPLLKRSNGKYLDGFQNSLFATDCIIPFYDTLRLPRYADTLLEAFLNLIKESADAKNSGKQKAIDEVEDVGSVEDISTDANTWKMVRHRGNIQVHRKRVSLSENDGVAEYMRGSIPVNCDALRVFGILSNPKHFMHVYDSFASSSILHDSINRLKIDNGTGVYKCVFNLAKEVRNFKVFQYQSNVDMEQKFDPKNDSFNVVMRSVGGYSFIKNSDRIPAPSKENEENLATHSRTSTPPKEAQENATLPPRGSSPLKEVQENLAMHSRTSTPPKEDQEKPTLPPRGSSPLKENERNFAMHSRTSTPPKEGQEKPTLPPRAPSPLKEVQENLAMHSRTSTPPKEVHEKPTLPPRSNSPTKLDLTSTNQLENLEKHCDPLKIDVLPLVPLERSESTAVINQPVESIVQAPLAVATVAFKEDIRTNFEESKSSVTAESDCKVYLFGYNIAAVDENSCLVTVISHFSTDFQKLEIDYNFCRKLKTFIEDLTEFTDMEHQRDSSVDVRMRDKIVTTLPNFRQILLEIGHLLF
jgi:hypothetical protein